MSRQGLTLIEVLIAVVIIAILAAVSIPQYTRTIERQRWYEARDMLYAIYAGEQTYGTVNNNQYRAIPPGNWNQLYMDNPAPADNSITYTLTTGGGNTTFTATANRQQGPCSGSLMTINQTRVLGGAWYNSGNPPC